MKILHIMNIHPRFTDDTVALYNQYFNNGEHEICYLNKGDSSVIKKYFSITQHEIFINSLSRFNLNIAKEINNFIFSYDYIVLHGFIIDELPTAYFYYLFARNRFLSKLVWIEWGIDLYDFKLESRSVKSLINYLLIKKIKNNVKMVVGIFPPDVEVYKNKFPNSKALVMYAPYFGLDEYMQYHNYSSYSRLKDAQEKSEDIYIQIGHNAQKQLNHIETLKVLSKFHNENIKIVIPLNYGDKNGYANKVEKVAKELFNEKTIILKDYLPQKEYFELINRVDIAVFGTYRQTGLSNIYNMINNNVKLFMFDNSVMYDYFNSIDIPVMKIEDIQNMSFEEFIKPIDYSKYEGPQKLINWLMNNDERIIYWKNIYNKLREING